MVFPDSSQNLSYGYDAGTYGKGRLTSATDPAGSAGFVHDALGRVTTEDRVTDGVAYQTGYAYDPATGDLSGMTYPSGLELVFQYDANGRVSGISSGGQTLVGNVAYKPFGPLKSMDLGPLALTRTYDQRYQITGIQAGTVLNYGYTHDGAGNVETVSGLPKPDLTPRQTDVAYTANRLTSIDTLWTIPPDYPATGASYTYDNAGNITSDGLHTDYFYNQNNRLIRMEIDGLTIAEYAYDAFERRVKKVVNGVTTHFHYDLNGLLISETDGNGNPRKDYVYLNGEPVAMKTYGGSAGWYWFINDHLGTPQKMVDESGSVVWAAAYAPFGEARVYKDEVVNDLRFPGQYYDVETGLHYNWHRYYDPGTGRYLRADPIGLAGGMNLYAYVQNNPINWVDLWGLERKPGKTPPSRWPQPPTNVVGKKPKWKPEGYWSGKGRKVTWDDRSHGTGVDRGQGPQGGHWDDECSENRWDEEGNPLPGSPDVEKNLEFNIHPGIPTAIGGGVLSVIILIISGGAYSPAS